MQESGNKDNKGETVLWGQTTPRPDNPPKPAERPKPSSSSNSRILGERSLNHTEKLKGSPSPSSGIRGDKPPKPAEKPKGSSSSNSANHGGKPVKPAERPKASSNSNPGNHSDILSQADGKKGDTQTSSASYMPASDCGRPVTPPAMNVDDSSNCTQILVVAEDRS
ncbi:hypothetical protein AB5N19_02919 [Seiridium cardinale]